jgi:hypothetical protein
MNGIDGNPQSAGLVPVNIDVVFGHIVHAVGPDPDQAGVLGRHAEKLVARLHEFVVTQPSPVHELQVEAGAHPQFDDRRRRKSEDHGFLYL